MFECVLKIQACNILSGDILFKVILDRLSKLKHIHQNFII